jgi:hypothetical protein
MVILILIVRKNVYILVQILNSFDSNLFPKKSMFLIYLYISFMKIKITYSNKINHSFLFLLHV